MSRYNIIIEYGTIDVLFELLRTVYITRITFYNSLLLVSYSNLKSD